MRGVLLVCAVFATAVVHGDGRLGAKPVTPCRLVSASDGVGHAEELFGPRFGQVSEGVFGRGSGAMLGTNDWLVLDFGRETCGLVDIGCGARSGKNARVHYRFGESVAEALAPLGERGACNDHAIRDDVVSLPWFGSRTVGPSGFRFLYLANAGEGPLQIEYVRLRPLGRKMNRLGAFRCSDERLNAIFETAVRTAELCCQDYLWDGIKRDRLVWAGDMHPETMTILSVFGADAVLSDSLDYLAATCPPTAWMDTMPNYTFWWIRNLAEWYRFTGDLAYLKKHAAYLAKTFDHVLTGFDTNGVWKADCFLDWPTQHDNLAGSAGSQGLALVAVRETVFLAEAVGDKTLAKKARDVAVRLARQRPDPHGAKSAAAMLALSGLRKPREMFEGCLGRNGHRGVSTFYGYYMLEAMSAADEHRRALETVRDYWGGMIDMGATSFWEDFNLAWTNNAFRIDEMPVAGRKDVHGDYGDFCYKGFRHSLCHGWASGPAPWLIAHVLGIRPVGVGSKEFEISPDLCGLDWAEGAYALPDGKRLEVSIRRREDGSLDVATDAPDDVSVTIFAQKEDLKETVLKLLK